MATGKVLSGSERRPESIPQNTHKRRQGAGASDCDPSTRGMETADPSGFRPAGLS